MADMDLNPVIVHPGGAIAVDARIRLTEAPDWRALTDFVTKGPPARGPSPLGRHAGRPQPDAVKVREIMSRPVITARPDTKVKEAAGLMVEHGVSALPVLDASGALVGIVSEADLIPIEARPDARGQATPLAPTAGTTPQTVAEVMTREVVSVTDQTELSQATRTMLLHGLKRVPVMKGDRLVGIVSRRDLVKVIGREDQELQRLVHQRLADAGVASHRDVVVSNGVAAIRMPADPRDRRVIESVALGVAGVLEVRFSLPSEP